MIWNKKKRILELCVTIFKNQLELVDALKRFQSDQSKIELDLGELRIESIGTKRVKVEAHNEKGDLICAGEMPLWLLIPFLLGLRKKSEVK